MPHLDMHDPAEVEMLAREVVAAPLQFPGRAFGAVGFSIEFTGRTKGDSLIAGTAALKGSENRVF